jgi:hypothetical protein
VRGAASAPHVRCRHGFGLIFAKPAAPAVPGTSGRDKDVTLEDPVVVNAAGRIEVGPLRSMTVQDFERAMCCP